MRLRRSVLSCLLLTGLSLGVLSPARAADPTPGEGDTVGQVVDDSTGTVDDAAADVLSVPASHEEAQESLAEVKEFFTPTEPRRSRARITPGEGRDATLALRDLSLRMGSLSRAERDTAASGFQRPWKAGLYSVECASNICVHWKSSSRYTDRDATEDSFAYGNVATHTMSPTSVLATMLHVSNRYRDAGYELPRPDGSWGGTSQTDVYLLDTYSKGALGYCNADLDPAGHFMFHPSNSRAADLPAFCVLDNDYSKLQFPTGHTSLQDLQTTAAHEYFHAVQFAYDYTEDRWFLEATATWAEDEVYDEIDDNMQ